VLKAVQAILQVQTGQADLPALDQVVLIPQGDLHQDLLPGLQEDLLHLLRLHLVLRREGDNLKR
jgi:hypothetical protein